MTRITLRQIEAFESLMACRTMTAAADKMSVSQPAVSRLIADLEDALEMRLFERSGPRIWPTPAALRLANEVARVFIGLRHIEESSRRIRRFPTDPLRIAAPPFLCLGFMAKLVARLTDALPDLTISLHTDTSPAIVEQTARSEHDIGFCTLEAVPQDVTVVSRLGVEVVCLLPKDHPLGGKARVGVRDLAHERLFVLGRSGSIRPQIDKVFADAGITPVIAGEVLHAASLASFVSEGLGLALLDPFSARTAPAAAAVTRPFDPPLSMTIAAIAPVRDNAPRTLETIRSLLEPTPDGGPLAW